MCGCISSGQTRRTGSKFTIVHTRVGAGSYRHSIVLSHEAAGGMPITLFCDPIGDAHLSDAATGTARWRSI